MLWHDNDPGKRTHMSVVFEHSSRLSDLVARRFSIHHMECFLRIGIEFKRLIAAPVSALLILQKPLLIAHES